MQVIDRRGNPCLQQTDNLNTNGETTLRHTRHLNPRTIKSSSSTAADHELSIEEQVINEQEAVEQFKTGNKHS
jgi:hypothetical protein